MWFVETKQTQRCHCGGEMSIGFIPDHGGMASTWITLFVEGAAKARASAWQKVQRGAGLEGWNPNEAWAITAYRCADCGRVDMFATERPDPDIGLHTRK